MDPERDSDKRMSRLNLSDHVHLQQQHERTEPEPHAAKAWPGSCSSTTGWSTKADADLNIPSPDSDHLLLAVRAPCGGRFQQHFRASDTLLMVRASAERRYGTKYGPVSVETMDVPRRSFTDMDMTLAQCGIINRSVLCISLSDGFLDHQ